MVLAGFALASQPVFMPIRSGEDLTKVQNEALALNAPYLIFACSQVEFDCKSFKRTLAKNDLGKFWSENFVLAEMDVYSGYGYAWIQTVGVENYPVAVWYNSKGKALQKLEGTVNDSLWLQSSISAQARFQAYDQLESAYESGRLRKNGKLAWTEILELNGKSIEAEALARELLKSLSPAEFGKLEYLNLIFRYGLDAADQVLPYVLDHHDYFSRQNPNFPLIEYLTDAYAYNMELAIYGKDSLRADYISTHLSPKLEANNAKLNALSTNLFFARETSNWPKWAYLLKKHSTEPTVCRDLYLTQCLQLAGDSVFNIWLSGHLAKQESCLEAYDSNIILALAQRNLGQYALAESALNQAESLALDSKQQEELRLFRSRLQAERRLKER